jgi:hypothetical protein
VEKELSRTTSTDRDISTGLPSPASAACVRKPFILEKAFGGDVTALVAHFVAEASLDPDQIQQLRQLLAQKKNPREKRT